MFAVVSKVHASIFWGHFSGFNGEKIAILKDCIPS